MKKGEKKKIKKKWRWKRKRKKNHTKCEKKEERKEKKKKEEDENRKNWRIVEFKRVNPYVLIKLSDSSIPYYNDLALFKYTSISFSFHYPTFFITTLKSPFDLCVHWDIRVDIEMINKPMVAGLHRWNWVKHNPYILWE